VGTPRVTPGPRPVNLWGVPVVVLLVGAVAWAIVYAIWYSITNGYTDFPNYTTVGLAQLVFTIPIVTAVTAAVAFGAGLRLGRVFGPAVGGLAGLVTAAAVGYGYGTILTWWTDLVPTDTNRAAAFTTAWMVGLLTVAFTLAAVAVTGPAATGRRRARILGLGVLAAVEGLAVGTFVGATVAAVDAAVQACSGCNTPNLLDAASAGSLLGSWVGAGVAFGVGLVTAGLALYALGPAPAQAPAAGAPSPPVVGVA